MKEIVTLLEGGASWLDGSQARWLAGWLGMVRGGLKRGQAGSGQKVMDLQKLYERNRIVFGRMSKKTSRRVREEVREEVREGLGEDLGEGPGRGPDGGSRGRGSER